MKISVPFHQFSRPMVRGLGVSVVLAAAALTATPTQAAFHLWSIQELYSNSSGTVQYIELVDNFGSQEFIGGQTMMIANIGNTVTHSFTIPGNLPGESFGHTFLIGTAGVQPAGGPVPDYIVPNGFLFTAGGTINYWALGGGPYAALPTGGSLSLNFPGGTAVNSPKNFAGLTSQVPEPSIAALLAAGGVGLFSLRRRGSAA